MIYREEVHLESKGGLPTYHNVTNHARNILKKSGIQNGLLLCIRITQRAALLSMNVDLIWQQMD